MKSICNVEGFAPHTALIYDDLLVLSMARSEKIKPVGSSPLFDEKKIVVHYQISTTGTTIYPKTVTKGSTITGDLSYLNPTIEVVDKAYKVTVHSAPKTPGLNSINDDPKSQF